MDQLLVLATAPSAWLALVTLVVMEVVLGVDNLVFIALLSSRLPSQQGAKARRIGIGLSLVFRLLLVAGAAYVVRLTTPLFTIIGQSFSWRDLILIGGGLFSSLQGNDRSPSHHRSSRDAAAYWCRRLEQGMAHNLGLVIAKAIQVNWRLASPQSRLSGKLRCSEHAVGTAGARV
jgi:predicted tellurium resistance membrane protein TerC